MNLSENLKKIRKDNNLSQEALAEKLGVSRQSVSKWESGLAYPEMDKVIQLCNMFNVNIDELLNQNISEIEKNNNSKVNVNKYINECFDFVTKVVKTISSMKFWSLVKCVIEQIFIFLILWFIKTVIANFIVEPLIRIISIFTDKINSIIYNVGFSIYELGMAVIIFAVMVHIFKIRYMDYYLKGIENEEEKLDEIKNEDKKEIKEEKIIVRDPKHSGDNIFTLLGKGILFIIKLFVLFIGIPFCFSLVGFAVLFIISFLFVKTGYLFLGGFLGLIGCIIINMLILYVIIYFVLNKKINPLLLIISFFTSLILGGIGIGLILIGVKDFTYLDSYDEKYITKQEQMIKIDKDYYLPYNDNNIKYIETNSKEVKIVYEYPNICKFDNGDNYNYPICDSNDFNNKVIDYYLESLNNKVFINPDYFKVNVYASKDNIKKLIDNKNKYYENLKKKDEQIKKESQSNIN